MEHFYDGQIRRYLTQIVRLFSQFSYKDGKGNLVQVPVTYGDLSRQVGSILRDNSENKIPSAPRMAVYITGLEMDTARLSDSSYVNKMNIRERAVGADGVEYLRKEGKNYTVERLMPTPYSLSVNIDIWTTNTDQKLQILEQIFMLFNPSLEIQTTDNYIDWTSLSVLNIENINFSSRSIPTGTESEIDVATLGLKTPIYISPPVKVKKLGVITNIITAIFAEDGLEINIDDSAYAQSLVKQAPIFDGVNAVPSKLPGKREALTSETTLVTTSHNNYDLIFLNGVAKLLGKGVVGAETWTGYLKSIPEVFESGITELRLQRSNGYEIIGTVSINTLNETELIVNIDPDTLPDDTYIEGRTGIDYIIDPLKFNPESKHSESPRILLLGNVGHIHKDSFTTENTIFEIRTGKLFTDIVSETVYVNGVKINVDIVSESDNPQGEHIIKIAAGIAAGSLVEYELYLDQDGPDAWKNLNGTDFAASANDIVEWDGSKWNIVFKAVNVTAETFVTNMNTNTQYKWTGSEWVLSFEGEYPDGTWRLAY
jgi:hypothetical protein